MTFMDKLEAVHAVIDDVRSERGTKASFGRLLRALRALGLDGAQVVEVMKRMDYIDQDGNPYPKYGKFPGK